MNNNDLDLKDLCIKAYKKLKANVYYDKTLGFLRKRILEFEGSQLDKFANSFEDINSINFDEILDSIQVLAFPKKIGGTTATDNKILLIRNSSETDCDIEDYQFYIDMDIRGHILGVMWILLFGHKMDQELCKDSYGNRISKKGVDKNGAPTESLHLFYPYYHQYETWRDKAINIAQEASKNNDIAIINIDFKRFFYSIKISFKELENIILTTNTYSDYLGIQRKLTRFVFDVCNKYTSAFTKSNKNEAMLPIGFLPSGIIANYALHEFDKAILNGRNPLYYGRYVDDILIVDKIENNTSLSNYINASEPEQIEAFFDEYFTYDYRWISKATQDNAIFKKNANKKKYTIRTDYLTFKNSKICIQKSKTKIFFFNKQSNTNILKSMKRNILLNVSEFRYYPSEENLSVSDLYYLKNQLSPNKLNEISGVDINKYNLSKFLGKLLVLSQLVDLENTCVSSNDIVKIFTKNVILSNYSLIENALTILAINEEWDALKKLFANIIDTYKDLKDSNVKLDGYDISSYKYSEALLEFAADSLARSLSYTFGKEVDHVIESIFYEIYKIEDKEKIENFKNYRLQYLEKRMNNAYIMQLPYEYYSSIIKSDNLELLNMAKNYHSPQDINLEEYQFRPYKLRMMDKAFSNMLKSLNHEGKVNPNIELIELIEGYRELLDSKKIELQDIYNGGSINNFEEAYAFKVNNTPISKAKIAVANINTSNYENEEAISDMIVRGIQYEEMDLLTDISKVLNLAIKEKVNILVFPELTIPIRWLIPIIRKCIKNNIVLIGGLQYLVSNDLNNTDSKFVFNYSVVSLPVILDDDDLYSDAIVSFHLKNHYAPEELLNCKKRNREVAKGNSYELYCWNDFWFSLYCCYEITDIMNRSLFKSINDALFVIEWNKDTNYYDNIISSLSRDIHTFVIQTNVSQYGDSRITQPTKTEIKDMVKIKGGVNASVIVGEIDFDKLRHFQKEEILQQYALVKEHKTEFKNVPAGFNINIPRYKLDGTMWDKL